MRCVGHKQEGTWLRLGTAVHGSAANAPDRDRKSNSVGLSIRAGGDEDSLLLSLRVIKGSDVLGFEGFWRIQRSFKHLS